jgi:hypothetical protein
MNKEFLRMQQLAGLITENQLQKLLLESTNKITGKNGITILVSDYVKKHIMTHNKPGIGSVFKKGVTDDQILKMVEMVSGKVSGKGGPYQLNSPGIGYDLVLPIDDAKKLKDAKEGTVVKQEGPNKIKVPSISTSQPITDFSANKVSLLIFPSNPQFLPDDVKNDESILDQIKQGKNYSLVTAFPGNPDIPKASEWNGKYAVILPGQKNSTNENKLLKEDDEFYHNGASGTQTIIVPDNLGKVDSEDFYDQLEALGDGRMAEQDFRVGEEYEVYMGGDDVIFKIIKKGDDFIIDVNNIKIEENKIDNFDLKKYLSNNILLKEDEKEDLEKSFQKEVPQFVSDLNKYVKDPKVKAILDAGLDDGDANDDKLPYTLGTVTVGNLKPTQNEIDFTKSIQHVLDDKFGSLSGILGGNNVKLKDPIVTYGDEWIIDGHHRWSQVLAANPDAKMVSLIIKPKSGVGPKEVLKAVHGAIASTIDKVPSASVGKGSLNVLSSSDDQVKAALEKMINNPQTFPPSSAKLWAQKGFDSKEKVVNYLVNNLRKIRRQGYMAGGPGRQFMPQTDVGGNIEDKLNALAKGQINITDPF